MVLVLLAARYDRAGEAVVQPLATGAGHVRHHAIEHTPAPRIGVEPPIHEVAQASAGLRAAPRVRLPRPAQRIGGTRIVFEEADEVAHRDVAETHDLGIL